MLSDNLSTNHRLFTLSGGKNSKDRKYVMTTDDLANAMSDQGITVKKPPYFI